MKSLKTQNKITELHLKKDTLQKEKNRQLTLILDDIKLLEAEHQHLKEKASLIQNKSHPSSHDIKEFETIMQKGKLLADRLNIFREQVKEISEKMNLEIKEAEEKLQAHESTLALEKQIEAAIRAENNQPLSEPNPKKINKRHLSLQELTALKKISSPPPLFSPEQPTTSVFNFINKLNSANSWLSDFCEKNHYKKSTFTDHERIILDPQRAEFPEITIKKNSLSTSKAPPSEGADDFYHILITGYLKCIEGENINTHRVITTDQDQQNQVEIMLATRLKEENPEMNFTETTINGKNLDVILNVLPTHSSCKI